MKNPKPAWTLARLVDIIYAPLIEEFIRNFNTLRGFSKWVLIGSPGAAQEAIARRIFRFEARGGKQKTKARFFHVDARFYPAEDLLAWVSGKKQKFRAGDGLFVENIQVIWGKELETKERQKLQKAFLAVLRSRKKTPILILGVSGEQGFLENALKKKRFSNLFLTELKKKSLLIPPLKEFVANFGVIIQNLLKESRVRIDQMALKELMAYDWPGNLAEFHLCLQEAVRICERDIINIDDLPLPIEASSGEEIYPQRFPPELR